MRIFCCLLLIFGLLSLSACQFVEKILGGSSLQDTEPREPTAATEPAEVPSAPPEPEQTTEAFWISSLHLRWLLILRSTFSTRCAALRDICSYLR